MKEGKQRPICVMIVAVCICGLMPASCDRSQQHRTDTTVDAAVNVMMMTNPMGSLYGKTSLDDVDDRRAQAGPLTADSLTGCPSIDIGLSVDFTPLPDVVGSIDLAYNDDCIVHGLALSGSVMSDWSIEGDPFEGLALMSTVTFDALTMEGMSTDGTIEQRLTVEELIPYAFITGSLVTTHADGRTCSITYDRLTATVDLGNYVEFETIFPDVIIVDSNAAALLINGSATYTDADGLSSAVTFTDVKQPFGCVMPASGMLHLVDNFRDFDAVVDYGDGTCDTIITVTREGQEPEEIDVIEWIKDHCDADCPCEE